MASRSLQPLTSKSHNFHHTMPTTSKIALIRPGNPWVSKSGDAAGSTFYPFTVKFEDNVSGQANAKTPQPPWAVGDTVEYEVTGQDQRGNNKLKIKKPGGFTGNFVPGTTPATAGAQAPQPQQVPSKQWGGANVGMRTGMAINAGVAWLKGTGVDLSTEAGRLAFRKHALFFFHLAEKIESGEAEPKQAPVADPIPGLEESSDAPF